MIFEEVISDQPEKDLPENCAKMDALIRKYFECCLYEEFCRHDESIVRYNNAGEKMMQFTKQLL